MVRCPKAEGAIRTGHHPQTEQLTVLKTSLERVFSIRHPYNQFENACMLIGYARTKKEHQLK